LGAALLVLSLGLSCLQIATAQPQSNTAPPEPGSVERRKAELEVQKLELEVAKLKEVHADWPTWVPALFGLLLAAMSIPASFWAARRARKGELDQATHEKRLASYPHLVEATSPLALYFPGSDPDGGTASLSQSKCRAMGLGMSKWYFAGGGLLLSEEARDAYFNLARALTHACFEEGLKVPNFPDDSRHISREKIDEYIDKFRSELGQQLKPALIKVDEWTFGGSAPEREDSIPYKFKDYVFLQQLSSALRTKLSKDLYSRERPS
jgi:type IV secretory pathway TrbD component